jgi:hypothetical protein
MKYEGKNIEVKVMWNKDTDDKFFIAETPDGDIVDDYPLPTTIDSVRINQSTHVATDKYGQKFMVIESD